MLTCPRCHSKYPAGVARCPRDGAALVALVVTMPPGGPTEDVLVATGADYSMPPLTAATSPERPGAAHSTPESESLAHGTGQPSGRPRQRARASTQPHESVGRVLGNYRLNELIGRGGMGWVYRAEHIKLGREVALKLLKPEYSARRDSVMRFFQEARAVNKIRHRNIVDITDFVELDDGTTFIIMELLRGEPLSSLVSIGVDTPRALAILVQICDALGAAHAVDIVHRDMKPDNVFIADAGDGTDNVKLLDFGVAKLINQDEDTGWQTKAGSVIGTPAYMSPEQAGGLQVDGRSDIYSVGAIMYELFSGVPMFRARSFGEYVRLHLNEQPIPPSRTAGGADINERLERAIMRCLDKSPNARFATMKDLQLELLALLGAIDTSMMTPSAQMHGAAARPLIHSTADPLAPRTQPTVPPTRHPPPPRPSRLPWFAAGAVMLGAAAGLAFFLAAGGSDPARAPTRPTAAAPSTRPVVVAIDPTDNPEATRQLITVRFTSEPSGAAVYPDGAQSFLCRTPCDVTIDPADGGSLLRRNFELRRRGYRSKIASIELRSPPDRSHLVLPREGRSSAGDSDATEITRAEPEVTEAPPAEPETSTQEDPERTSPDRIDPEDTLDPFENR